MLPVTVVISESQFAFLMEVYFDPIIYFSMVYVSIWFFLSVNSQLIFTRLLPMDYQRPLISTHTLLTYGLSPGSTFSILYQYYDMYINHSYT